MYCASESCGVYGLLLNSNKLEHVCNIYIHFCLLYSYRVVFTMYVVSIAIISPQGGYNITYNKLSSPVFKNSSYYVSLRRYACLKFEFFTLSERKMKISQQGNITGTCFKNVQENQLYNGEGRLLGQGCLLRRIR